MSKRSENIAIGAELEEYVAGELRKLGLDPRARRNPDSGSGNKEKADIDTNLDVLGEHAHIECKNWSRHGMAAWIAHTEYGAGMHALPILVYKLRKDSLSRARAIVPLYAFLGLLVEAKGVEVKHTVEIDSKQARYFADKLNTAAGKLAKLADDEHANPRLIAYARQEVKQAVNALQKALKNDYGGN